MSEVIEIILPGMLYFWVLFIGQGPLQEILVEKENLTLSRILAAPVGISEFLLSKMIRCFLLCMGVQVALIWISWLLFGLHTGGILRLIPTTAACAFSMTGFLSCIYGLAKTREQANTISSMLILVFSMVGGSMFPFENLPGFLQMFGRFSPNRWGVLAMQGMTHAKSMHEFLTPLAVLTAIGIVGSCAAFFLFQRQLSPNRNR